MDDPALEAAGVPCAPVQDVSQMLAHEQIAAPVSSGSSPPGLSQPVVGPAVSFDGERPLLAATAPPALGELSMNTLEAA